MINYILWALFNIALFYTVCKIVYNLAYKESLSKLQSVKDASYTKGRDSGYTEGYKCGFKQGREIGQKEGRAEGFADGKIYGAQQSYNEEALRSMGLTFTNDKNITPNVNGLTNDKHKKWRQSNEWSAQQIYRR